MPKKTKKQKILAEKRRQNITDKAISYNFVKPPVSDIPKEAIVSLTDSVNRKEIPVTMPQTSNETDDNKFLRIDLMKILIFSIFALISQGMIYYWLQG